MMQLVSPIWLWGLLGLAVPLAIHLLSRKEGKVIKVGSLRHLSDSATRQFKSVKLNELLLLALRALLVAIIVALLSGVMIESSNDLPKWVVLERGVEANKEVSRMLDSLMADGYQIRYLEEGFPTPDDTLPSGPIPDYWNLAEELAKADLQESIVFSRSSQPGFKRKRVPKPQNINWFDVPAAPKKFPTVLVSEGDSVWEVTTDGNDDFESFLTSKIEATGAATFPVAMEKVSIVYDDQHAYDEELLRAALSVINDLPGMALEVVSKKAESFTPGSETVIFWLANGESPQFAGKLVSLEEATDSENLLVHTAPARWMLTRRLNKKAVLENHLILQLAELFKTELPALLTHDQRVMPESWRWSNVVSKEANGEASAIAFASINEWLLLLLVITLTAERLVAWRRGQ